MPIGNLVAKLDDMDPLTIGLITAGISTLASGGAAIGAGINTNRARAEEQRNYQFSKDYLNSEYYRDPLSSVGYRALIKNFDERRKDENEALRNRSVAGGATVENTLAAKQAINRTESNFNAQLLQGEEARRQRLNAQRLQLENQHSQAVQRGYLQDAQNWQQWGAALGDSLMNVGSAYLLGE